MVTGTLLFVQIPGLVSDIPAGAGIMASHTAADITTRGILPIMVTIHIGEIHIGEIAPIMALDTTTGVTTIPMDIMVDLKTDPIPPVVISTVETTDLTPLGMVLVPPITGLLHPTRHPGIILLNPENQGLQQEHIQVKAKEME